MYTPTTHPATKYYRFDQVGIYLFGQPENWDISGLQIAQDLNRSPVVFEQIKSAAQAVGVNKVLAPVPSSFNALVTTEAKLDEVITDGAFSLCRGIWADGAIVTEDTAFWVSSADCPTIISWTTNKLIAAHAGRDSLIDPRLTTKSQDRRQYFSIVDTIMDHFREEVNDLQVAIVLGIHGSHFDHPSSHPRWGEINRQLIKLAKRLYGESVFCGDSDKGRLDLRELIRLQFAGYGVTSVFKDTTDTFSDSNCNDWPVWHSHVRANQTGESAGRNGVLVTAH